MINDGRFLFGRLLDQTGLLMRSDDAFDKMRLGIKIAIN